MSIFPPLSSTFGSNSLPWGPFFTSDVGGSVRFPSLGHRQCVRIPTQVPAFDVNFPWFARPSPWGLTLIGALRVWKCFVERGIPRNLLASR